MFGYHLKLLRVDLTNRTVQVDALDEALIRKYIGGLGIEAKILYEETNPETDPLSPENPLMAVTGPFTGTGVPSSGRHHLVARSPLTGFFELLSDYDAYRNWSEDGIPSPEKLAELGLEFSGGDL